MRDEPQQVEALKEKKQVRVSWASGHESVYPFDLLRGYCPCAVCQGHGAGAKKWITPPEGLALQTIKPVGAYALQFVWSDGHSTGLYTYDYLRGLCPCCAVSSSSTDVPS